MKKNYAKLSTIAIAVEQETGFMTGSLTEEKIEAKVTVKEYEIGGEITADWGDVSFE